MSEMRDWFFLRPGFENFVLDPREHRRVLVGDFDRNRRDELLIMLEGAARAHHGQNAVIFGDYGRGKTHLCHNLLYEIERRYVRWFGVASPVLFIIGVTFMFFIVLPIVLNFFASLNQSFPVPSAELTVLEELLVGPAEVVPESPQPTPPLVPLLNEDPPQPLPGTLWFNQTVGQLRLAGVNRTYQVRMRSLENAAAVSNQYSIDFYVSFILTLSLAFGVAFQLPIVVIFLSLSGIVSVADLARARKYVIFGIVIASALLTPPDVFSQILLAIPMAILYEGGLIISRMMIRSRAD